MPLAVIDQNPATDLPTDRSALIENLRRGRAAIYQTGKIQKQSGQEVGVWPVGLTTERGDVLLALLLRERVSTCVETGMAYGLSTSFLMEACLQSSRGDHARDQSLVTSIDPFEETHWGRAGVRQLESCGVAHLHTLHASGSEVVLPRLVEAGRRFDAAFIDGDHRFEHVFLDIFYARKLVGSDHLIIVDDAWMPSVRKACDFFVGSDLCRREPAAAIDGRVESKFIALRVTAAGDDRAWDHFQDF